MAQITSPLQIVKLLDNSNCGKCSRKTCLAFASAVFTGEADLAECPKLDRETIDQYREMETGYRAIERTTEKAMEDLKARIRSVDLADAARRIGAAYGNGKLTIKVLGKDVSVDADANILTEIHVNRWLAIPVYTYILESAGQTPSGEWVTFRELDRGENIYPLFEQRCEKPLKQVADTYTGLFADMLQIFNGKQVDYHYDADISIMLDPLPKVPVMICYSRPEEDIASALSIFFDATVRENLGLGGAFNLGAGLTAMFQKLAARHGG